MKNKQETDFTVTDKRRFTAEGDAPKEAGEQPRREEAQDVKAAPVASPLGVSKPTEAGGAPPPSADAAGAEQYETPSLEERKVQEDAFDASAKKLDAELASAMGSRSPQDLQMTFERFVASIYMSALMQLGLIREQGAPPPPVDLMGARQTIDTLTILADKTKGNLALQEENLLQNCLYELRMAYVEVTNAITRTPPPGQGGVGPRR